MADPPTTETPAPAPSGDLDRIAQFELALVNADAMTWVWEIESDRLTWAGRGVDYMFGVSTDVTSFSGQYFLELVHPDDRRMVARKLGRVLVDGGDYVADYRTNGASGEVRGHVSRGSAVRDEDGKVIRLLGVVQDITDRRRMEEALRESEERFKSVLAGAPLAIVAFDIGGTVTLAQGSALDAMHIDGERLVGTSVRWVLSEHPEALAAVDRTLAGDVADARIEFAGITLDASYRPLRDAREEVIGAVIVATDVTEKVGAEEQLARLALHDPLTDLANRVLFNNRLELHLARSARRHGHTAVLFLDLDRFKEINDTHGHHIGDDLLRGVADRLRASVRPEDTIARFGGDEFLILGEVSNAAEAETIARRILTALSEPMQVGPHVLQVGVSIGAAITGPTPEREVSDAAASLIRQADGAMYQAKQAGRARYVVVSDTFCGLPTMVEPAASALPQLQ